MQDEFTQLIRRLNRTYRTRLLSKFVITIGDEFQALLHAPEIIPDLAWTLDRLFTARQLRLGFGYGLIYTSIGEYAINVDGPALHNARAAIVESKQRGVLGGVFQGFGSALDPALNGFARLLYYQRASWPERQREVVTRLHDGIKGTEIAAELGITKQAVSRYAALAGWDAYAAGEEGWKALLQTVPAKKP